MGSYQGGSRLYRTGVTLSAIRYRKGQHDSDPVKEKKVAHILLICSCYLL